MNTLTKIALSAWFLCGASALASPAPLPAPSTTPVPVPAPTSTPNPGAHLGPPMIEVGGGYEYEVVDVTVPHTGDPAHPSHATDSSRSGARLAISIQALNLDFSTRNGGGGKVVFVPLYFVLDPSNTSAGDGFGRVIGHDGRASPIRRVVGALVDTTYRPNSGMVFLRGKLAQVDYDRDRGFWDWRALDAEVGIKKAWQLPDGRSVFNLEMSVGAGIGAVNFNNFREVQQALDVAAPIASAYTLNPHALMRAGFESGGFKIELMAQGEQRVDLSSGGTYLGNGINASSQRLVTALDAEYRLPFGGSMQFSLFGHAEYDFDNLTLSHALFGTSDSFQSFMVAGGIRGRF